MIEKKIVVSGNTPIWFTEYEGAFRQFEPTEEYYLLETGSILANSSKLLVLDSRLEDAIKLLSVWVDFGSNPNSTNIDFSIWKDNNEIFRFTNGTTPWICPPVILRTDKTIKITPQSNVDQIMIFCKKVYMPSENIINFAL